MWAKDMDTDQYFETYLRMLEARREDVERAATAVGEYRKKLAEQRNARLKNHMRPAKRTLTEGDMVLLYDNLREMDKSTTAKFTYRWRGPYIIKEAKSKSVYILRSPDGIELEGTYPPHRLKKFIKTDQGYWMPTPEEEQWLEGKSHTQATALRDQLEEDKSDSE